MIPRFLADENIAPALVLGLRRRVGDVDIVGVQDVGLRTADDHAILEWAAEHHRVLISHDLRTIPSFAGDRLRAGLPMAGVILLPATLPIAQALDQLAVIAGASDAGEWANQIAYLPLR